MKLADIHIRDPYVLKFEGIYYMYGTNGSAAFGKGKNFEVFISDNLKDWKCHGAVFEPANDFWADMDFWAPEVHYYNNQFFMFASFKSQNKCRGTQILVSDSPKGPFIPHSNGCVTPNDWECLDGTLYEENGTPYIVFCHEWTQIKDGSICAIELSKDLKEPVSEPFKLFNASEPSWALKDADRYVTDGPFLFKSSGKLMMIWSTFIKDYVQCVSQSDGGIKGKWTHFDTLLFEKDGGHGMLFTTNEGTKVLTLHNPNTPPLERPHFFVLDEQNGQLSIEGEYHVV